MDRKQEVVRSNWVVTAMMALFFGAVASQANVQIFRRQAVLEEFKEANVSSMTRVDKPVRGSVLDSQGALLAQSTESYVFGLDYRRVPQSPAFFLALAEASGISEAELKQPSLEGKKSRTWSEPLGRAAGEAVRAVRKSWRADGVSLDRLESRRYPLGADASGVVGVLRNGVALNGIERGLDTGLTGAPGHRTGFVDRTGLFVRTSEDPVRQGETVRLTLNATLQQVASQAVREAVTKNKAKAGCAIVLDPRSGDVLALANWPSFDPDRPWKPGDDFNMAVMGAYEPGSTFKALTLAKALDEGVVTPGSTVVCNGVLKVGKREVKCAAHGGNRAHGVCDNERAIAKSCNVAAASWALRIGHEKMVGLIEASRILERPRVGLPGARGGVFNRKDGAPALQTANLGFGQALNVTPLQLAAAFGALANHGTMMPPRLIDRVGRSELPREEGEALFSPESADTVLRLMESVIESDSGTGKSSRIPGYRLAGKTGTAQKLGSGGGYVSNFVGFVPAREPRAVILVMIDSPSAGAYYGGTVAGPVFTEIARSLIRTYSIPPTRPAER
ncbi:MAG: penicillin-binding protein 2 [Fimbriimonadaceae bacterium]|nr:penicillin-binding protein 2 [Fimbriimonadaceae bacterium]QYK59512.1 MAG: penicillin-binding protein 2 [Fimbriimonadaceae bacterium]